MTLDPEKASKISTIGFARSDKMQKSKLWFFWSEIWPTKTKNCEKLREKREKNLLRMNVWMDFRKAVQGQGLMSMKSSNKFTKLYSRRKTSKKSVLWDHLSRNHKLIKNVYVNKILKNKSKNQAEYDDKDVHKKRSGFSLYPTDLFFKIFFLALVHIQHTLLFLVLLLKIFFLLLKIRLCKKTYSECHKFIVLIFPIFRVDRCLICSAFVLNLLKVLQAISHGVLLLLNLLIL